MITRKQGTRFMAISDFTLKPEKGRGVKVKVGDWFVITNTSWDQNKTGLYMVAREKTAKIGQGYYVSPEILSRKFADEKERVS